MRHNAKPTEIDGIMFASQAESRRYLVLKSMQDAGEITLLTCQPKFTLQPAFKTSEGESVRAITYTGDFMYHQDIVIDNGCELEQYHHVVVEDVKPFRNTKSGRRPWMTEDAGLKIKMFKFKFPGVLFRIVEG